MALTAVYDRRLNSNYEAASFQARDGMIMMGYLAATYSGTGGLSWTLPINGSAPIVIIPPQSNYFFQYSQSSGMITAYSMVVTTTALASVMVEVASDTDFTALPSGGIRFVAFGYGG